MAVYNLGRVVGQQGETGNGISNTVLNDDYTLTINYTNGDADTTDSIRGEQGPQGDDYVITQQDYQAIADVVKSQVTIPTKLSDLSDDSTHRVVTDIEKATWNNKSNFSGSYNDLTDKPIIPDVSNFITKDVNDLTYYYTKTEVDGKVSAVYKYRGSVEDYEHLPSTDLTVGDVYNVEDTGDNYAWTGTAWDKLSGTVDLSGYQTKIDSTHKLSADLVDDTSTTNKFVTTSEKSTWNAKYDKPSGGIPDTDLSSAVQTSLGKADTALQSINSTDVTTALGYTPYDASNPSGYTTNTGTITSVKMNGTTVSSSGEADLGTVITEHQDISGKENISNKVTSMSSSSTDTQYPSAKSVYDALHSDLLHYKGHVNSTSNLPTRGQSSASLVSPYVEMASNTSFNTAASVRQTALETALSNANMSYGVVTAGGIYNYTYAVIASNNPDFIKGVFTFVDPYYNRTVFHVEASAEYPVYISKEYESSATSSIRYENGTVEAFNTSSAKVSKTITQNFYLALQADSQRNLLCKYPKLLKIEFTPKINFADGTGTYMADYTENKTYRQTTLGYNYAEDYYLLQPNSDYSLSYITSTSTVPDAELNDIYTVGSTKEIYRCNSVPDWEHWSATDTTGLEQTSNKVTSLSNASTDTQYPSAKCVYDLIGDVESLLSEV